MIVKNDLLQCLECTLCGECLEYTRAVQRDPEKVLLMIEELQRDHAGCAQWAGEPARARAERMYLVNMRNEIAKAARRSGRRKTGKRSDGRTGFAKEVARLA